MGTPVRVTAPHYSTVLYHSTGPFTGSSLVQKRGDLGEPILELIGHPIELGVDLLRGRLLVDGARSSFPLRFRLR